MTTPSILFLTLHRPDRSPSQRFRFEEFLQFLGESGFQCDHVFLLDERADKDFYSASNYFKKFRIVFRSIRKLRKTLKTKHTIVFVQREAFMLGTTFFEKKLARRSKFIYDFDDSIWLQNVSEANKKFAFLKNPDKTAKLIGYADLVFAGNDYLASYARQFNENVAVVPTTIDTSEYRPVEREKRKTVCIGWSGSTTTIQHFEYAVPALKILKEKYGDAIEIRVIGDGNYRNDDLKVIGLPWKKNTEIADLGVIDIGIMPLPDDEWSRGKCGLKGLQYMALEIATVMSPVGVNSEIIANGVNGMLASSTEEWVEKLSGLIENEDLRLQLGKAGRETVEKSYSVNAWKNRYLELFNSLV